MRERIIASLDAVEKWVEDHHYRGYEPFDGLSSVFRPLTFGTRLGQRLLLQLIRQSPINLRPIMGVKPQDSTKGRGYMAHGYAYRYQADGRAEHLAKARACLDWLDSHKAPRYADHSWSNHFDFASRGGTYTKHDPIIVWTALIGQAYLETYEQTREARWLEIADSVCRWIMAVPREDTPHGRPLSYFAHRPSYIHNASMLGAAMLARTAKHTGNRDYVEVARSAMAYSCHHQRPDGSWWYAEHPAHLWIDNFHTGYNIDSLKCYIESTGDSTWEENLRRGLDYYKRHFFEPNGCPKYYHNRMYPVDSQCAAQSIETLAGFAAEDPECRELALRVTEWTIENMQDADGHFYYRIYPLMKAKAPMLHWAQGTMYKALAFLVLQLHQESARKTEAAGRR